MVRDERVQSAIDNWAPRFISNGVALNDFQRVTNSVENWDDWSHRSRGGVLRVFGIILLVVPLLSVFAWLPESQIPL